MSTEYEDEWAADKEATDAQTAADAGVAAGKKADADPDFNYDPPGAQAAADAGVAAGQTADAAPEPVKPLSFKETFAARRKAGDSTFEWNGKKYTTDLKKPVATSAAPAAPKALVTPLVKAAAVADKASTPAAQASYAKTSSSSGRNYAPVVAPKEVPSPAKTSFGRYAPEPAPATPRDPAKVQTPAAAPSVRAPGASPARTSFSSGRSYAPAPEEVPSPARTSFGSGRNYPVEP